MDINKMIVKLKDLGDGSYEEVGTVGEDSEPVIWSKKESPYFHFELSLVPDFIIEHNSGGGYNVNVKCHAIFPLHTSVMRYGFSEANGEYSKDILTRFKLGSFEDQYQKERCRVQIWSESDGDGLAEDGISISIEKYGGMPDPYNPNELFIGIQVSHDLLKGLVSSIQSNPNTVQASLFIYLDEYFYAGNVDGLMFNFIDGINIKKGCSFSFKTGENSGYQMAEIIKKSNSKIAKQKRRKWVILSILITASVVVGLLAALLIEQFFPQFTEWLN
ncbi:MAG: hypothetical protein K0U20_06135 [Proteobacteria bacterium]|nr:hypothetical protein [Pseudomonadota bacterium]MCH9750457.1 hypothetical protein [Pseudomonadota bacterium]